MRRFSSLKESSSPLLEFIADINLEGINASHIYDKVELFLNKYKCSGIYHSLYGYGKILNIQVYSTVESPVHSLFDDLEELLNELGKKQNFIWTY